MISKRVVQQRLKHFLLIHHSLTPNYPFSLTYISLSTQQILMSVFTIFLVIIMPTAQTLMVVSSVNATMDILVVDLIAQVSEIQ